ncbi:hypothetical protein [Clostridium fungisolvens]|uniref:Uncharacterized protein n=1 Tax=Clostridium fungisolvens TaxID=1604897 RepID=A0A6V8SGT9_9CLOT|nr:hypothetical protein [Clostridium fungisolvens]GFP76011.1 hypothetical protein bsdtw1_02105 [Clostridium fungisolvens]
MKLRISVKILSILILLLSLLAAVYGVFSNQSYGKTEFTTIGGELVKMYGRGLYHNDSVSIASQAISQDIVTIILAVPLLLISMFLANKGLMKGKLLLTGTLGYFFYTYTSYSFLSMYNKFFLIYVALMSMSFFSLTLMITSFDIDNIKFYFSDKIPRKFIGGFLLFMSFVVGLMWVGKIGAAFLKGGYPEGLEYYTTLPIQALDLGFVVPIAIMSGILLIKNKSLGYLLAPIMIIKEISMLTAITAMIIGQIYSGISMSVGEMVIFPCFNLIIIYCLYLVISNVKENNHMVRR